MYDLEVAHDMEAVSPILAEDILGSQNSHTAQEAPQSFLEALSQPWCMQGIPIPARLPV